MRYSQLRVDVAPSAKKAANEAMIQQAAINHTKRGIMEPNSRRGFDEADHSEGRAAGSAVRKAVHFQYTAHRSAKQGQSLGISAAARPVRKRAV
jgi:hypothetical protein